MRKKRMLAFLMAACLALTPAMAANAGSVDNLGGHESLSLDTVSNGNGNLVTGTQPGANGSGGYAAGDGNSLSEDFESVTDNWGMSAITTKGTIEVVEDNGNHYLKMTTKEGERSTSKVLVENAPDMETSTISFKWYTTTFSSTSGAGYAGIRISDGDNELVTLYLNDIRGEDGKQNTTPLYYTVYGSADKQDTGKTIDAKTVHDIEITFDFTAHQLSVKLDGDVAAEGIDFLSTATKADKFTMLTEGAKPTVNMGIDDFYMEWTTGEVTIVEDFESVTDNWGMSAITTKGTIEVVEDNGNHYLKMTTKEGERSTSKVLVENAPDMETSTISFKWYTTTFSSTSGAGYAGIRISDGDNELVTLYLNDIRGEDGKQNTTPLYYTVYGSADKQNTGKTIDAKTVHDIEITFDFTAHQLSVKLDGAVAAEGIDFLSTATKADKFTMLTEGAKPSVNMGIDDFYMYYKKTNSVVIPTYVTLLEELQNSTLTKQQYEAGGYHPAEVQGELSDGTKVTVQIDASTWKAENKDSSVTNKDFNPDEMGQYTWTADIIPPQGVTNPLNLKVSYDMKYMSDFLETDINSIKNPETVNVKKEQWTSGTYTHPTQVAATLVNGRVIVVPIDQTSWTSSPAFDVETKGSYVWTADLLAPAENRNHRNLKVSYTMNYAGNWVSTHDYEDDFSFGIDGWNVWGKDLDKPSGTGGFGFELGDNGGDPYLLAFQNDALDKNRGSRLDLPADIVKGAVMEFDFLPVNIGGTKPFNILFVSPAAKQNYFTLCVDSKGQFSYHTTEYLAGSGEDPTNNNFDGVISSDSPVGTNVGAMNKWAHVKVEFDYVNHTAALTLSAKDGSGTPYTVTDIPIDERANGLSILVIHKQKDCDKPKAGFDNIIVDYDKFGALDIVDVIQPSNVNVSKTTFDSFEFPKEVTVKLGDGSKAQVTVGQWVSVPDFDADTEAVYEWTAPLVTDKYTNLFKLQAAFQMNYTELPYVVSVNNPPTLELEPGADWSEDQLPQTVTVCLSDGTVRTDAPVEGWTAIRAYDGDTEGIYVYGAKLAQGTDYAVIPEHFIPNEYHGDAYGASQTTLEAFNKDLAVSLRKLWNYTPQLFEYDVFYRISCDASANGYNSKTRSMEYLDRGVTAIPSGSGILVSWRVLVEEYGTGVQFNVLRNGKVINDSPITAKSNYLDPAGQPGNLYSVQIIKDGKVTTSPAVEALSQTYLSIPLQKPEPQMDKDGNFQTYSINDAGVADVDGDGQYEVVVKWYPSDAFDSGKQDGPSGPTIFDCYELDGTPLWRINMGLELPSGAHFNQFMLYDLDEDGKAEFFVKTSDGTVSYKPNAEGKFDMTDGSTEVSYIGDRSIIPGSNIRPTGHADVTSNEYISIFNGATGEEIDTIDYVNTVTNFEDYNDNWGNRASRFNIAMAYQPKAGGSGEAVPTVLLNRGYYAKTTVAAYQLIGGHLTLAWNFDVPNGDRYAGKGNHNVSTGDMDNDGYDELVIGALAIDHDGSVLWAKDGMDGQDYQGHSDSIHLTAMNPEKPTQLYVFTPSEEKESTLNGTLSNAANGSRINGMWHELGDIGRGVAANITPNPGFEYWINTPNNEGDPTGGIYNFFGEIIASTPPGTFSTNWRLYWDGDLLSELGDGRNPGAGGTEQTIYKYDWENNEMDVLAVFEGTHTNNGTKNNPSLTADLFGDWREEVLVGDSDNNELRIYMTPYETEYMIYSLMQDPVYRNAVANQNTSYNQPPHLGFYLGEDNRDQVLAMQLPKADIRYTTDGSQSADKEDPKESYDVKVEAASDADSINQSLTEALKNEEVKNKTGCSTPEALQEYMEKAVKEAAKAGGFGDIPKENTKMLEIHVMVKVNNSEWVAATKENFPAEGVDITIPYPDGTTKKDYEFVISHLITIGCNRTSAGDIESFSSVDGSITKTDAGLEIHITSASPFIVGWEKKESITPTPEPSPEPSPDPTPTPTPDPGDDTDTNADSDDDGDSEESGEDVKQDTIPKTGDTMNIAANIWMAVLIAAVCGTVSMVITKRKKDRME